MDLIITTINTILIYNFIIVVVINIIINTIIINTYPYPLLIILIQLGHVYDLATAFVKVLGNKVAYKNTYNISGERFVTFDGIARACAQAAGKGEPELIHYNPKEFDFGKAKAFPLRDQHFFASVDKAISELGWTPKYGLVDGLRDSYEKVSRVFILNK